VKLLLGTHIWVWSVLRPEKIRRKVRRHLDNPKNELYLSPISIWEAHLLERRSKLRLKRGFAEWVDQALRQIRLRKAPLNFAVAAESRRTQLRQRIWGISSSLPRPRYSTSLWSRVIRNLSNVPG
jgi:PIN domain nuclease of toxin-antitoxin system